MAEATLVSPTLLIALLRFAHALTQYPIPETLPTVHLVPQSVLQEKAREFCNGRCRVFGWYPLGKEIYFDESQDLEHDAWAQSKLLHELVHWLQHHASPVNDCPTKLKREAEAYRVQDTFLTRRTLSPTWGARLLRNATCSDASASQ